MALPLALLALVVIAALVSAGFAAAMLEQRIGRNLLYAVQAEAAAVGGAVAVVGGWDGHGLGLLAPGDTVALPSVALPGRTKFSPTVSRPNTELYEVRVTGTRTDADGGTLAQRTVSLIVRRADSTTPGAPPVTPLANRAWSWVSP